MVKHWEMNATQKKFVEVLKANPGKTLKELSQIAGVEFKTGSINPLKTKGIITYGDKKEEIKVSKTLVNTYFIAEKK